MLFVKNTSFIDELKMHELGLRWFDANEFQIK